MTLTTNSFSKTSLTPTRYLSKWPVTLARCRSPWESLALHFLAILSSCLQHLAAVPSQRERRPQDSRWTRRLLSPRRSAGVRPPRPRTALAAGCPTSGTPPSTTTSPRMTCRTQPRSRPSPSRPLLLFSPFSKEGPPPLSNLWVISLFLNQRVTRKNRLLYQRRKTNTVSFCRAVVGKHILYPQMLAVLSKPVSVRPESNQWPRNFIKDGARGTWNLPGGLSVGTGDGL